MQNQNTKRYYVGGHRGKGCTDHRFFQNVRPISILPVENTLSAFQMAFREGADFVELDAVMSASGLGDNTRLFTIHNVVPDDHFFGEKKPLKMLNQMPFDEIQSYQTGRYGFGSVTPLLDTLKCIKEADPNTAPYVVNIEIKGVQGSGQQYESNDYLYNLSEVVKESGIDQRRVLFSSFCLQNILEMSYALPQSQFGMLFNETDKQAPIYSDKQDSFYHRYLPFNEENFNKVSGIWTKEAHKDSTLGYVHPEILTVTKNMVDIIARSGMGMNPWTFLEEMNPERLKLHENKKELVHASGINHYSIITDYISEMNSLKCAA
jgi:glycerophosphoryl diester phosphodiesterase